MGAQVIEKVSGTHALSGVQKDGHYIVSAGKKGEKYRVKQIVHLSADDIKRIRRDTGLSVNEFSKILGVSESSVESWEKGSKSPEGAACRLLDLMNGDRRYIEKFVN